MEIEATFEKNLLILKNVKHIILDVKVGALLHYSICLLIFITLLCVSSKVQVNAMQYQINATIPKRFKIVLKILSLLLLNGFICD